MDLVLDEASVAVVRGRVREVGAAGQLPELLVESMATAASELAHNQLRHALSGRVLVRAIERGGVPGIEIIAADRGNGILDPAAALRGDVAAAAGLGSGVAGVRRLVDEMDVDVRVGEGTCVWARKFVAPPSFASEVGIFGRALEGEDSSGDHAVFARTSSGVVGLVIDGLGHGVEAARAARRAGDVLLPGRTSPVDLIDSADRALEGTRGAVVSAFHLDYAAHAVEHACVGNLRAILYRPRSASQLGCEAGILGARQRHRPPRSERVPFAARDLLVVATDGISSRFNLLDDARVLREHPVVIAQHVFERFGRSTDDALVLVAR